MWQDCGCPVPSSQSPSTFLTTASTSTTVEKNLSSCIKVRAIQGNKPTQCRETVAIKAILFCPATGWLSTLNYAYLCFFSLMDFSEASIICFVCFWIYQLCNSENLNNFWVCPFLLFFINLYLCVHVWFFVCINTHMCGCQQRPKRMSDPPWNYKYRQLWVT